MASQNFRRNIYIELSLGFSVAAVEDLYSPPVTLIQLLT